MKCELPDLISEVFYFSEVGITSCEHEIVLQSDCCDPNIVVRDRATFSPQLVFGQAKLSRRVHIAV